MSPPLTAGAPGAPPAARWIRHAHPVPSARLRLLCLPHAGGTAMAYRTWPAALAGAWIEVCPVQLPGREDRFAEPAHADIAPLVAALAGDLAPLLDRPYALFGHSMGTLPAFELAHAVRARGGAEPAWLFVSGHRAPTRPRSRPALHALPEPALLGALRELGGTPAALFEAPDLLELYLPTLRADLAVTERYQAPPRPPLTCPVTAFGGSDDPRVDLAELEAWREITSGPFDLRLFDGGHFYLKPHEGALLAAIQGRLDTLA